MNELETIVRALEHAATYYIENGGRESASVSLHVAIGYVSGYLEGTKGEQAERARAALKVLAGGRHD